MSLIREARLCKICSTVFSSHWVARDSIQQTNANQAENFSKEKDAFSSGEDDTNSNSSFESAPGWATVLTEINVATSQLSITHRPLPHHNLAELEESASRGCYLCIVLFGSVHDQIEEVADHIRARIGRLQSYIVAQPSTHDPTEQAAIEIEISYYIDGVINSNTFACSVRVFLHKVACNF